MGNSLGTKLYYSIGEVAELTQLAPYTLRAWETEFSCLRPKRVRGKNRAYRERDIAIILLIRRLLHQERYSTKGAQQKLRNEPELIRGAVEHVARLVTADPPTLEEMAAAGHAQSSGSPEPAQLEARPSAVSPPSDATKHLLDEVRRELREILRDLA
ncbi:MAG TPA: MerR family transcriptional regulator [Candidatus Latescibacteria bacterium]|nr:MerR family transcriptional regulator [Candidatus Latescibacterota bacterium]